MFLTPFYLTLFYQTQILQTLIIFTLICMTAIRPAALSCGLDLLQLLYVQVLSPGQRLQCQSLSSGSIASPCCSLALWVASGRVFASLVPGPGMASAAAVSALDPEPLFVLSAKRKFLSVYQGLRKEAAA